MPSRPFKRAKQFRLIGRSLIIVCEGKETEYGYFEAIRQSMRLRTLQVEVIHPNATDPRSIVSAAIEYKQERIDDDRWRENNDDPQQNDTVWAVFDGDEHLQHAPQNWNDAIQLAENNDVNLAVSNPCFELWYLLHYQNQNANINRNNAKQILRNHIPNYEKSDTLYPDPLENLTNNAISRAEQLSQRTEADELPFYTNPSTGVYKLVRSLLKLKDEANN